MSQRVLVVDNYDSFVYILVQYLGELGAEPLVYRHDAITPDQAAALSPDRILISPGPGTPDEAGVTTESIHRATRVEPSSGVGLGMPCIGQPFAPRHRA